MSKRITKKQRAAFIAFIDKGMLRYHEDPEPDSLPHVSFCVDDALEGMGEDPEGWDFCPDDNDKRDLYDLFDSHPKYQVEEHGYDDFIACDRENE